MKKIFTAALASALLFALATSAQAACPSHGRQHLYEYCAGYPNNCETRECFVGSHPKDCQTQRFSNYGAETCLVKLPNGDYCPYGDYTDMHLCYVIHPAVSGDDYYTGSYCPWYVEY